MTEEQIKGFQEQARQMADAHLNLPKMMLIDRNTTGRPNSQAIKATAEALARRLYKEHSDLTEAGA